MEKILYNVKQVKPEKPSKIEIALSEIKEDSLLDEKEREKDFNDDNEENSNFGNEKLIQDNNEIEKKDKRKRILPRLRFTDFILNNFSIFSKKCKSNKQDIISKFQSINRKILFYRNCFI